MIKKRIFSILLFLFSLACIAYLGVQVNQAFQEYKHWKTRESVLEQELEILREEARTHQQFLDRLRRNPDFQDEVARQELGYGNPEEWLYRFPEESSD